MIYDCFTFFNELDLLEIRLNTLDKVVDKFVLVEATKTFTNKDKSLYFKENRERFKQFEDKIIYIVVDDFPPFDNAWTYEFHQRNNIVKGLTNCADTDTVLISDLDEIPNPETVRKFANTPGVKVFKQKMYYYFVNNINIINPYWVNSATRMLSYADFKKTDSSAQKIRFAKGVLLEKGGWHFSYLGGVQAILTKIESWAHQEFNTSEYADAQNILQRIEHGQDLFYEKNGYRYAALPLSTEFPEYILQNKDKFAHFLHVPNLTFSKRLILLYNSCRWTLFLWAKQVRNKLLRKY